MIRYRSRDDSADRGARRVTRGLGGLRIRAIRGGLSATPGKAGLVLCQEPRRGGPATLPRRVFSWTPWQPGIGKTGPRCEFFANPGSRDQTDTRVMTWWLMMLLLLLLAIAAVLFVAGMKRHQTAYEKQAAPDHWPKVMSIPRAGSRAAMAVLLDRLGARGREALSKALRIDGRMIIPGYAGGLAVLAILSTAAIRAASSGWLETVGVVAACVATAMAVVAGALDYIENAQLRTILNTWQDTAVPEQPERGGSRAAATGSAREGGRHRRREPDRPEGIDVEAAPDRPGPVVAVARCDNRPDALLAGLTRAPPTPGDGWAQQGSNLRPLACKASALPLSYTPLGCLRPRTE